MKNPTPLKKWMAAATPQEQEELAQRVGTSRNNLYQYAGGFRSASAERAGQIEDVTADMSKRTAGRLPRLYRTDLASACKACPFAARCLGAKAEFSLL